MSSTGIVEGYGPPPGARVRWAEPASDQFDFWCGVWRGETVGGDLVGAAAARNQVDWQWGGAVLLESFTLPSDEGTFEGRSWSVPVPDRGWCQTWVDSDGQYLDFVGGLVGEEMVLDRESVTRKNGRVRQRMLWWDVGADAFSWAWLSAAEGATEWTLRWELRYTRL
jgi:hypothetical protein